MTETNPGGRPAIGPQVRASVPAETAEMLDEIAERTNSSRPDVVRRVLTEHTPAARLSAARDARDQHSSMVRTVRPAADLLAAWIGEPVDAPERRERFVRYRRSVAHGYHLGRLLMQVSGERALAGHPMPEGLEVAWRALAPAPRERYLGIEVWRWRSLLWFEVLAELGRQDVTVAVEGGDDDGVSIDFGPDPDDSDEEDEEEFT